MKQHSIPGHETDTYLTPPTNPQKLKKLKVANSPGDLVWKKAEHEKYFETVMVHMHGGGFVGMSSSSHQNYLIPWAKELKIPIFSIDYRLAPETQYPAVVNDVINAYLWVLYFVEQILKIKIHNLIVTGDSAGGNLTMVLTNWCIVNNIRKPDFIFPHYPACTMDFGRYYTPSFLFSWDDPFLNYSTMRMCCKYYVPHDIDASADCYLSP